jgi:putative membrane protein
MASKPFKGMYLFICGLCMGAADLIPGISGGTIAFIMGFYFPLLESLKSFNSKTIKLLFNGNRRTFFQKTGWKFLLILGFGIVCSFFLFANFIHHILMHEVYRVYLYSTFLGLILGSFYFCIRQIKKWSVFKFIGLLLGTTIAFLLTGTSLTHTFMQGPYAIKKMIHEESKQLSNYQTHDQLLTHLSKQTLRGMLAKGEVQPDTALYTNEEMLIGTISDFVIPAKFSFFNSWLIFCGALAVCALLLPGISGSYIFTILGVYPLIIGSLSDWITHIKLGVFDWESFHVLLNVGIGIVLGFTLFARFLSWLLKTYFELSLAILSGFMLGALHTIWPFWTYTYAINPLKLEKGPQLQLASPIWPHHLEELLLGIFFALLGFGLVIAIEWISVRKARES